MIFHDTYYKMNLSDRTNGRVLSKYGSYVITSASVHGRVAYGFLLSLEQFETFHNEAVTNINANKLTLETPSVTYYFNMSRTAIKQANSTISRVLYKVSAY